MTDVAAASDQPSLSLSAVQPSAEPPLPNPAAAEVNDTEEDDKDEEDGEGDDDEEEEEEDDDDDDNDEEAVDEEGEPDYIWLSPAEFNDPNLPYLLGAPANPKSTRTHSRRQKSAESLFPHLSDTLYRCKEYPHGIYVNSFGQLCPDDKRSGLYQIDERAAENDQADDVLAQAEDAVAAKEAGLEDDDDDEDDDEEEEEDKDNDDAPPDARDVTWVDAENKIRAKKGLKRKKVVPDDDEDDYQPESGEEEEDDDKPSEEGDAEEMDTDDEFQDEELEGTDDDHEWDPVADKKEHEHGSDPTKKKKAKTADNEDDDDDEEEEEEEDDDEDQDSQGRPLAKEADEYEVDGPSEKTKEPKVILTAEQQKEAFLKSMKAAEESQDQMNKAADLRQRQRIQDQKNLRLLENWSEEWKKIRGKIFREEKASEKDPELRKKIKNTSITMTFEAHILSKTDPGCDFVFRKPVVRPKKGEAGPKPVPLPPIAATFDCTTSEVICGLCTRRFSNMMGLYRHLAEHFMELKIRQELKAAVPVVEVVAPLSTPAALPPASAAAAPPVFTIIHNVF